MKVTFQVSGKRRVACWWKNLAFGILFVHYRRNGRDVNVTERCQRFTWTQRAYRILSVFRCPRAILLAVSTRGHINTKGGSTCSDKQGGMRVGSAPRGGDPCKKRGTEQSLHKPHALGTAMPPQEQERQQAKQKQRGPSIHATKC